MAKVLMEPTIIVAIGASGLSGFRVPMALLAPGLCSQPQRSGPTSGDA